MTTRHYFILKSKPLEDISLAIHSLRRFYFLMSKISFMPSQISNVRKNLKWHPFRSDILSPMLRGSEIAVNFMQTCSIVLSMGVRFIFKFYSEILSSFIYS